MDRQLAVSRLLCAVDTTDIEIAKHLSRKLKDRVGGIKLGLEFYCRPRSRRACGGWSRTAIRCSSTSRSTTFPTRWRAASAASRRSSAVPDHDSRVRGHRDDAGCDGRGDPRRRAARRPAAQGGRRHRADQPRRRGSGRGRHEGPGARAGAAPGRCWPRRPGSTASSARPTRSRRCAQRCGNDFLLVVPGVRPAWATAARPEAHHHARRRRSHAAPITWSSAGRSPRPTTRPRRPP